MINLQPLHDNVVLEPIEKESRTKGGIVLPETAEKEKPQEGKVAAVGPGRLTERGERVPVSVKKGDKVLFKKYSPDEIKIDNKEYLIIKEEDIIAIIK